MGGQDEVKELSVTAVANLTDHMLELNSQGNDQLNVSLQALNYKIMPTQSYILLCVPHFQMILQLTSVEDSSKEILISTINELMNEALEDDPDLFYAELVNTLYCQVIKAINIALGRSSNFKQKAFYSVMISDLSRVNLIKDKTILPESLLRELREMKENEEG